MFYLLIIAILFVLHNNLSNCIQLDKVPPDQDVGKDMVEIVESRGFNIETHYVTTLDGYILTMFRIPYNNKHDNVIGKPILLQHGLCDSSYTWVNNYEDESLGYILSNAGYDVWFGNNRGNRYGRNHTTLNPDNSTVFWEFSWDEMARYDVPAMIHYVLDISNYDTLSWIGHSAGNTQIFAASSIDTTNNQYLHDAISSIQLFIALSPVAYISNQRSELFHLFAESDIIYKLMDRGLYEFLPYGPIEQIAPEICALVEKGCDFFLMSLSGPSLQLNASRIQVYVSETPAGTSAQNMLHWTQGANTPSFQMFDYGSDELNVQHYGVNIPPLYNLSKLNIKTALFAGKHDYIGDLEDVQKILLEVPSDKIIYYEEQESFAHIDYVWAPSAAKKVYPQVISLLKKHYHR